MGILNVTDDSFYDGGRYTNDAAVLRRAEQILSEGAAIIDVGAVSTKPGAADISVEEEWKRLEKPLELIAKNFPDAVVSVDTWRADIAQRSVEAGAAIINDVSGGTFDERMAEVVGRLQVPYVLMHTTAKPDKMQQQPLGEDMLLTMMQFFARQLAIFKASPMVFSLTRGRATGLPAASCRTRFAFVAPLRSALNQNCHLADRGRRL